MDYQYHISIDELRRTVMVDSIGAITSVSGEAMYTEVFHTLRRLGYHRVLLDNRKVELAATPVSIMKFIETLKDKKMLDGVRLARLVALDCYTHEFVEQVADHHDVRIKNFDDRYKALVWLTSEQEK
ncbi:MAG: hypothetical protein ACI8WB_004675 [Phenylobacterium sp.]|jgi:hypothetical protein